MGQRRTGSKEVKDASHLEDKILILSDSTGDTAESFVRAILAQFGRTRVRLKRVPNIANEQQLTEALKNVTSPQLVIYTFAAEQLRKLAWALVRERNLTGLDLFYPAVEIFANFFMANPSQEAGLLHSMQAENYFDRVEAIEFTVKHDDGMKLDDLKDADLILVGVSRSSKTPTSIYLAHKGYRVANVPMVPGIDIPDQLVKASQSGVPVVCLSIRENDLERIRRTRFQNLVPHPQRIKRGSDEQYLDPEKIRDELRFVRELARKHRWPIIDVTDRAIEETASEILVLVSEMENSKS